MNQREARRREVRRPDNIERVGSDLQRRAYRKNRQQLGIKHVQIVARREAVRWIQDVRACPANELLSDGRAEPAGGQRGGQPLQGQTGPLDAAVVPVESPLILDLAVRIRSRVDAAIDLEPARRLPERLLTEEDVANNLDLIVWRCLRETKTRRFDEPALR